MSHDFEIAKTQLFDISKKIFLLCISDFLKLFRRKILRLPGFEPTPVEYRPCILPLSYGRLIIR